MSKIYGSFQELIGNTPIMALKNFTDKFGLHATILAKLECFNPAGSSKDRVAMAMIEDAEKSGLINKDTVIIEPTSGSTGIGLAAFCASRGYKVILTMPETMSAEKRKLLRAYGAKAILTDGSKGMQGAITRARELSMITENSFVPSQYTNPANPRAHETTTGPEIWEATGGNVDIFVSGVGTGGTLIGVGNYLRSKNSAVKLVAVEAFDSPVLSQKKRGLHKIEGISSIIPEMVTDSYYDEIVSVKSKDAIAAAKELAKTEGILAGISSGAALCAAAEVAQKAENAGKTIVALFPDTGERYYSTGLFEV